ncbi:MAG: HD domain-containing phosphohydrolase, partial [Actinomycetota bacterium]
MTAGESHDGQRWGGRGTLAVLLRGLAVVGPAVAAWLACTALRQLLSAPVGAVGRLTIGALLLVVGVAVAFGVTRLTARLAPLAWLLRIDTAFPDAAPSRFELAQRANRTKDLVTLARSPETPTDQRTAAERILVLAAAIAAHDRRTRGHSERVRAYTRVVGQAMGLRGTQLDKLAWAGLLHDVGKLVVEPEVLTKPGRLDVHEHRQIQQHPVAGFRMAEPLVPWLGDWGKAILHHHERFDGTGYPFGLAGDDSSPRPPHLHSGTERDVDFSNEIEAELCGRSGTRQQGIARRVEVRLDDDGFSRRVVIGNRVAGHAWIIDGDSATCCLHTRLKTEPTVFESGSEEL